MAEYLTLVEAAKLTQNQLQKGVIEIFARTSPVLERIPFMDIAGQALVFNREGTLPSIGFRSINETPTPDQGVVNPLTEKLMVLGGISQVDRALVRMQGNVNNLRAIHDGMKAKSLALTFTKAFFKGDNDSNPEEFDGLETRLTGGQRIDYTDDLLEALDATIDAVVGSPDVLFMNKPTRRAVNAAVRSAGQAIEQVSGAFGQRLEAYAGIPIGVIEEDSTGAQILGFDEAGDTTSIYAVRFGAGEFLGGIQSGGIAVEDLGLVDIFYKTLIEHICGVCLWHPRAASRLQGVPRTDEYGQTTTTSV